MLWRLDTRTAGSIMRLMQITHHDVLADRRLARGIIMDDSGRSHRCLVDLEEDRGDCSCGEACPALALLRERALTESTGASQAPVRTNPTGSVQMAYVLSGQRMEIFTVKEGRRTPISLETVLAQPCPRFVDATDVECASRLRQANGVADEQTIVELAAAGRLIHAGARMELADDMEDSLEWHWHDNGDQSLRFRGNPPTSAWPHIRILETSVQRLLHHGQWRQPDLACWRRIPLERISAEKGRLPSGVPEPFVPREHQSLSVPPTGLLHIDGAQQNLISVCFDYGGHRFCATEPGPRFVAHGDECAHIYPRSPIAESRLMEVLVEHDVHGQHLPHGALGLARFSLRDQPSLEASGWQVTITGAPEILTAQSLRMDASGGVTIQSGVVHCDPNGERLDWEGTALLKTESGAIVAVPLDLLHDILMALGSGRQVHPARLASLDIDIDGDFENIDLGAMRQPIRLRLPDHLDSTVRDYQRAGVGWLWRLYQARFGGILADDMGLGKTLQTLCLLALAAHESDHPSLIVAPASLLTNWQREARRFVPELRTMIYHGSDRRPSRLAGVNAVITTYGILRSDQEPLAERQWNVVVLDEAHQIKNPRSKAAQAARSLTAVQRIALSGTPMENHLGELWSLFRFAQPGLLEGEKAFTESFRRPIEQGDEDIRSILTRRIAPFILRRQRGDVLTELPPMMESCVWVEMGPSQRALYESVRATSLAEARQATDLPEIERRAQALEILTRLRQICCAPQLLPDSFPGRDAEAAKLETAASMILELAAEGRSVLVFSQFTSLLELLEVRLDALCVRSLTLTGSTRNRQELVDRFQAGEVPAFLISLKAGGSGLNLTRADTVILLDPWWNPAAEAQAAARAHRMGQTGTVFVYRLIANDTVEQAIETLKAGKTDLTDQINASLEGLNPADPKTLESLLDHA